MYHSRIVIAEGDPAQRKILKQILSEYGYQVTAEVSDGIAVLKAIQQIQPDLAIIDAHLPVKNGVEVARILDENRIAPVLLLTSSRHREIVESVKDTCVFAHLIKPVQKETLIPAIEIAIANFQRLIAVERELKKSKNELKARKIIDQAKAILMKNLQITEPEAFRMMQKQSMQKRKSMEAIAESIVATYCYK